MSLIKSKLNITRVLNHIFSIFLFSKNKFLLYFKFTALFSISFFSIHFVHINLSDDIHIVELLIFDLLISSLIMFLLIGKFHKKDKFVIFVSSVTSLLLNAIYALLVPVMIDRSISVDMLFRITNKSDEGILIEELRKNSFNDNVITKRLKEQKMAGIIKIENGKAYLTRKGKFITNFYMINKKINILNK